jgi:hypothetical protein
VTLRPADANEVVEAYRCILQLRHEPAVLVLSRQALPTLDCTKCAPASGVAQGAYVLADAPGGTPEIILIASGSEVSLAVDAHAQLLAEGIRSRVVSMPSWDLFEHQPQAYRDSVLPPAITARVAIEQASTFGWERYVGCAGRIIGMKTFGASAPLKELQRKFGFEPERVAAIAKELLGRPRCWHEHLRHARRSAVGGEPRPPGPLESLGAVRRRARLGNRSRGLQCQRRRVGLLPPRTRPLARLPLERGRPGRHLRPPSIPLLCRGLWNGRDPILKERMFGLAGPEGNHGEDVKE